MKGSEVQNETKNTTTINTHTKYAEVYKYTYVEYLNPKWPKINEKRRKAFEVQF